MTGPIIDHSYEYTRPCCGLRILGNCGDTKAAGRGNFPFFYESKMRTSIRLPLRQVKTFAAVPETRTTYVRDVISKLNMYTIVPDLKSARNSLTGLVSALHGRQC